MTRDFAAGHYRFIPAVFQYSRGACATLNHRRLTRLLRGSHSLAPQDDGYTWRLNVILSCAPFGAHLCRRSLTAWLLLGLLGRSRSSP
jgi:hypothetical protein